MSKKVNCGSFDLDTKLALPVYFSDHRYVIIEASLTKSDLFRVPIEVVYKELFELCPER